MCVCLCVSALRLFLLLSGRLQRRRSGELCADEAATDTRTDRRSDCQPSDCEKAHKFAPTTSATCCDRKRLNHALICTCALARRARWAIVSSSSSSCPLARAPEAPLCAGNATLLSRARRQRQQRRRRRRRLEPSTSTCALERRQPFLSFGLARKRYRERERSSTRQLCVAATAKTS